MSASPLLEKLIKSLQIMPGIGPRSAVRIAYHLLDRRREESVQLKEALIEIYWYEDGSSYSSCVYENCSYTVEAEQLSAEEIEEIYTNWIY